ncbi:putative transcriptional regulator [Geomicrobium halophilum]|uniref:Putative transcriptional regulator n=1 Tax=Geomicrobium halophilum TaxID=549000 RepID=A0A841PP84_9BACL|nr:helix-turn-helix transcriptional regulator [Geomicrobium halophilum]MBB6449614.1 putative transcriptional regulator [Geomicrobium halophilum]
MIVCTLGKIMKERGLTNRDVVELTGVSRNTVKGFQTDSSRRIDFDTMYNLCVGLNVEPGDLFEIQTNNE